MFLFAVCVQGGSGGPADPAGSSSARRCRETIRSGGSLGQDEGPAAAHNRSHSALQVHTPVLRHTPVLWTVCCSAMLKEMCITIELFLKTQDVFNYNILTVLHVDFKLLSHAKFLWKLASSE